MSGKLRISTGLPSLISFSFPARLFLAAWILTAMPAHGAPVSTAQTPAAAPVNPVVDLMLIYDGGQGRAPWTAERFAPYVYRENSGNVEWLFDGFLFIEFIAKSGARLCPITNRKDATKADWEALLDHYFQDGQSMSALDQLLASQAGRGHRPLRKRRVVMTLPTPISGSDPYTPPTAGNWGELNGRKLDFTLKEDAILAASWYVDETLKRWETKKFGHLELAGFYWVFERAWGVHSTLEIGNYIRSKNFRFYWIPSWPQGRKNWRQFGFDFVYQQPNYFFHRQPTPPDRLETACQFAESCGTSMEMEFNHDLLTKPIFLEYFDEYIQAYEQHNVWQKKPVAYYEGGGAWGEMARSTNAAVKSRLDQLTEIIVARQKKADNGFRFDQGAR
jgi:hypothetical protein